MKGIVLVAVLFAVPFAISPVFADRSMGHDEAAPAAIEALADSIKALEERVRDLELRLGKSTPTSGTQILTFESTLTPGFELYVLPPTRDIETRLRALESGDPKIWLFQQKAEED